ncbi:MAG: hypothetical protein JWO32_502 [Bacteroidetes bacterium]|nr:hypothetical protein [Bacteroidota bacterium]
MTPAQFKLYWSLTYPNSFPVSHLFRHYWPEKWFRVHSLPASKRYAETEAEWLLLLDRQNEIISDLLENAPEIYLVTDSEQFAEAEENLVSKFTFTELPAFDLHLVNPNEYDKGQMFKPVFTQLLWKKNKLDDVLKVIAEDNLRAFFISIEKQCIIAPYDGGIDFILKDVETRNKFKNKYKTWLSPRPDGL